MIVQTYQDRIGGGDFYMMAIWEYLKIILGISPIV